MYKIVCHSFTAILLLVFYSLLPTISQAQPAAAPAPASKSQTAAKSDSSKKVKNDLGLDFSNFNWGAKKKTNAKADSSKKVKNDLELDFSNFNWNPNKTGAAKVNNSKASEGIYQTVTIGTQIWMLQNLNETHFSNGDIIPEAKTDNDWNTALMNKKPVWCYYEGNATNGEKYGKLYNVYAVLDPRNLAPAGWHIPTLEEWKKMASLLPDNAESGLQLKGTGAYAFIQGGYRKKYESKGLGSLGQWWGSTPQTIYGAWGSSVKTGCTVAYIASTQNKFFVSSSYEEGSSVRCIKNK